MDSIESTDETTPLVSDLRPKRGRTVSEGNKLRRERNTSVSGMSGTGSDGERGRERTFSASDVELELPGCAGSCFCHPQALLHE